MPSMLEQLIPPNPIYQLLTPEQRRAYGRHQLDGWLKQRREAQELADLAKRQQRDRERRNEAIREELRQGTRPLWSVGGLGS